jgi:hypothetical protein
VLNYLLLVSLSNLQSKLLTLDNLESKFPCDSIEPYCALALLDPKVSYKFVRFMYYYK